MKQQAPTRTTQKRAATAMPLFAVIVTFGFILGLTQAHAQTLNHLLQGLSRVDLVIDDLDEQDKECGLTKSAVRTAVMYPLSSSRIEVDQSADVVLYVAIGTLSFRADRLCVSHVKLQVLSVQSVMLSFSDLQTRAEVELWHSGGMLSSDRDSHARRITGSIEQRLKKFITDWNLDNKAEVSAKPRPKDRPTISSGTGFAVTEDGHFVTNEHVVSKCSTVTLRLGQRIFTGTVAARDSGVDLALIRRNDLVKFAFARLRQSTDVKMGDQAIAYGFPLRGALADEGNLTLGNVSAMHGLKNDPNEIQISTPVQPGNSGGPLLDSSGNVIGVVSGKLDAMNALARNGDLPQNVNFAISLSVLKEFLGRSGVATTDAASRFELRPDEVGERAKTFTYAIECDPSMSSPDGLATGKPSFKQARPASTVDSGKKEPTVSASPPSGSGRQPLQLRPN
jgi:S1-C subfamily serine protease